MHTSTSGSVNWPDHNDLLISPHLCYWCFAIPMRYIILLQLYFFYEYKFFYLTYLIGHNNTSSGFRPAETHPCTRLLVSWSDQWIKGTSVIFMALYQITYNRHICLLWLTWNFLAADTYDWHGNDSVDNAFLVNGTPLLPINQIYEIASHISQSACSWQFYLL